MSISFLLFQMFSSALFAALFFGFLILGEGRLPMPGAWGCVIYIAFMLGVILGTKLRGWAAYLDGRKA